MDSSGWPTSVVGLGLVDVEANKVCIINIKRLPLKTKNTLWSISRTSL